MEIGSVSKLLSGSEYSSKAKDIEATFAMLKIQTLSDLDNAPVALGPRVAGYSTYAVCAYLREAMINKAMEPVKVKPRPKPEPEKEPEPEPDEGEDSDEGVK